MNGSMGMRLQKVLRLGRMLEERVLTGLFLFLLGFALLQILLRNIFSTGVVWGDTLARHVLLWLSLLGTVRATWERKHIGIDLLPVLPAGRFKQFCRFYNELFSCLTAAALCYASSIFVLDERLAGDMAIAGIPTWWLEIVFPAAFFFMSIRFAVHFVNTLQGKGANGSA